MEGKLGNVIVILVAIVFAIAMINLSATFIKISDLKKELTGRAANVYGYVNLTVNTVILLNMTNDTTNFGPGVVYTNATYCDVGASTNATLRTQGGNPTNVTCGNWSDTARAIVVENLGTINCTLSLQSDINSTDLVQGNPSVRSFAWNVTNKDPGSCRNDTHVLNHWIEVNTSTNMFCYHFGFMPSQDEVMVDFKVIIPYDSPEHSSGATITFTGDTAP